MTPEDLSLLTERLLDDAVPPAERAALAGRLAHDAALHQALADELALALQIRATLAADAGRRADLLMATLSGSRRLELAQRIEHAIDQNARRASTRWLPSSGLAAAALLMVLVGAWWLHVPAPTARTGQPLVMPLPAPPVPAPSTAPVPDAVTPATQVAIAPRLPPAAPVDALVAPPTATATPVAAVADPVPSVTTGPAPEPAPGSVVTARPDVGSPSPQLSATQTPAALPKVDPKALRGVPPLLIHGSAQVRRQGRVAPADAGMRLVPGDELRVTGDGATLSDERGLSWWCAADTRLGLPPPRPVEIVRQPLQVTLGTLHVTSSNGLRPLITTPHLRIDAEEADLWLTVTTQGTRVETIAGSVRIELVSPGAPRPGSAIVRGGSKSVRPLAAGFYALSLPGTGLEIHPAGEGRLSVIGGRFVRDGVLRIPRILRGVSATLAADLGGIALQAPLGDGAWLDQAAYRHLTALVELPATIPASRILLHPALGAWIATSDVRAATAMRRADPLRPIHLAGPAPGRLPAWATSSELAPADEAPAGRATLAMVGVDAQVQSTSWDALIRGAQGLVWSVDQRAAPAELLPPLLGALEANEVLLTDGVRTRLDLGTGLSAAQWDHPGRRLVVVVNRGNEARAVQVPHSHGLTASGADEAWAVATNGDITTADLPAHAVLILQGALP